MHHNQDLSNDQRQSELSLKESLQQLADQLNETPHRKISLSFLYSWIFGTPDVIAGFFNFAFWGIPVFFITLGHVLGYNQIESQEIWGLLLFSVLCILGFGIFYHYCKAVYLFKNGYFTLGYFTENGLVYKDRSGNQHFWPLPRYYGFAQPFMDSVHLPETPYLVVIGANPMNLMVLNASSFSENNDQIGFRILKDEDVIIVSYDLQKKSFIDNSPSMWRLIIPVGLILWTILSFVVAFYCE